MKRDKLIEIKRIEVINRAETKEIIKKLTKKVKCF